MKKVLIGEDVKRTLMVVAASVFSAWNINTFVHAAGLLPVDLRVFPCCCRSALRRSCIWQCLILPSTSF